MRNMNNKGIGETVAVLMGGVLVLWWIVSKIVESIK